MNTSDYYSAGFDPGYSFAFEEDGVYLRIDPASPRDPFSHDTIIINDILRRNIDGVDIKAVMAMIKNRESSIRLSDAQDEKPCDGAAVVTVDAEEMNAYMQLLPPVQGKAPVTLAKAMQAISSANVTAGVDSEAVKQLVEAEIYSKTCIAIGQAPQNGTDGSLEFGFRREITNKLKAQEDGSIDFRELDKFEHVHKGQVLVKRTPATKGIDGYNVRGRVLSSRNGRDVVMPRGRNVQLSEDNLVLTATMDGRVEYENGKVLVSNVYEVNGDVDLSVGNIDFDGDVKVRGNVISGITIKAKGNIEVTGIVECATLIAGKSIALRQGIQGMDKGELRADGNIAVKFIERASVYAGGSVSADAIIHSIVEADETIIAQGKRGTIIGGSARAGKSIVARVLGSSAYTVTGLEVGITPVQRQRMSTLAREIREHERDMPKIDILLKSFERPSVGVESPDRALMRIKVIRGKTQLTQSIKEKTAELEQLKEASKSAVLGKVHVLETANIGVKISIGAQMIEIDKEVMFATFKIKDGEIAMCSLEYNQK